MGGYDDWVDNHYDASQVLKVNVDELDFVNNGDDRDYLIKLVRDKLGLKGEEEMLEKYMLRYKVNDYVYIREDLKHNKEYGGFVVKDIHSMRGRKLKVRLINELTKSYSLNSVGYGVFVNDKMIDHDKTKQLPENHYKRKEKRFNIG